MAAIKDKIINCISINLSKEKYGNPNKKHEFYIEAEDLFKDLVLRILIERSNGDPLAYVECLENFEEICDWDFYDTFFVESLIFGD